MCCASRTAGFTVPADIVTDTLPARAAGCRCLCGQHGLAGVESVVALADVCAVVGADDIQFAPCTAIENDHRMTGIRNSGDRRPLGVGRL